MRNIDPLTQTLTKISLILGLTVLFVSCNAVKHLKDGELLLEENNIIVEGKKMKDNELYNLLTQKPNPKIPILRMPLGLHIYNIAEPDPDSTYQEWLDRKPKRKEKLNNLWSKKQVDGMGRSKSNFNDWLKRTGSAPVIIDKKRSEKSIDQLKRYYATQGWFNVEGKYTIVKDSSREKRGSITFNINKHQPYFIDSIS